MATDFPNHDSTIVRSTDGVNGQFVPGPSEELMSAVPEQEEDEADPNPTFPEEMDYDSVRRELQKKGTRVAASKEEARQRAPLQPTRKSLHNARRS